MVVLHRMRSVGAFLLAIGTLGAIAANPEAAGADAGGLIGVAIAQPVRATYGVPDFLVVSNFVDAGAVAQSVVDSTGRATGFASLPYPGENAISAPGVIAAGSGQPAPAGYPFYVRADHPTMPSAELKDPSGSYSLRATADQGQATGAIDVVGGGAADPVSTAQAHTSAITDAAGKLTVSAESVLGPLSLGGGALRIATVRSRSVTVYARDAREPKATAELTIEGAKVGDTAVTIGPGGVRAAGQPIAPPAGAPDPVAQALTQAGVNARIVSAAPLRGGAASEVLEIVSRHGPPGDGSPQGTFALSIGGVSTSVTVGQGGDLVAAVPVSGDGPASGDSGGVSTADQVLPDSSGEATAVPVSGGGFAGPVLGGGGVAVPGAASPAGSAGSSGPLPSGLPAGQAGSTSVASPATGTGTSALGVLPVSARRSIRLLFGVVAAAGAVVLSMSTMWRAKGVHATWMGS